MEEEIYLLNGEKIKAVLNTETTCSGCFFLSKNGCKIPFEVPEGITIIPDCIIGRPKGKSVIYVKCD